MPMALVIQSSEPTEGPKMPEGLVISESKNPEYADNMALSLRHCFFCFQPRLLCRVSASVFGVRRRLCSAHRAYVQSCRAGKVCTKVSV